MLTDYSGNIVVIAIFNVTVTCSRNKLVEITVWYWERLRFWNGMRCRADNSTLLLTIFSPTISVSECIVIPNKPVLNCPVKLVLFVNVWYKDHYLSSGDLTDDWIFILRVNCPFKYVQQSNALAKHSYLHFHTCVWVSDLNAISTIVTKDSLPET